ncbi:MFS transporter, partial [Actinomadura fibrosa]
MTTSQADAAGDRRVIGVVTAVQLSASLGFFAVMAHVVAHLRDDAGLLAGTIGLVLGVRILVQYALLLPFGALVDVLGAARSGALACVLRTAGFALLAVVDGVPAVLAAAVLLGAGGAVFHPCAQALLAGTAPAVRARGYAAYAITG